jgi:hypothetical protein
MTDYRSDIAGNYSGKGPMVMCLLVEGAPTVTANTTMADGQMLKTLTWASPLEEGQVVALANDADYTYVATEGMPAVQRAVNAETLVIGQIVLPPTMGAFPANTAAGDSVTKQLAGKYYRMALVEFHVPGRIVEATIMANGANALIPGVMTTLNFNMASAYTTTKRGYFFDSAAANGVGGIPLHYVPTGVDGDTYSSLVLLTGMLYSVTGTVEA